MHRGIALGEAVRLLQPGPDLTSRNGATKRALPSHQAKLAGADAASPDSSIARACANFWRATDTASRPAPARSSAPTTEVVRELLASHSSAAAVAPDMPISWLLFPALGDPLPHASGNEQSSKSLLNARPTSSRWSSAPMPVARRWQCRRRSAARLAEHLPFGLLQPRRPHAGGWEGQAGAGSREALCQRSRTRRRGGS